MEFLKVEEEDLTTILDIENKSFIHPYKMKDLIYELKENPVSYFYKCVDESVIKGFIIFWITFDSATICQVATKEEYRKQGVADYLVKESEKILKKENVEFYTLEVRASNLKAQNLYLKNGFSKITTKERYYDNGEDAIYMVKGEI